MKNTLAEIQISYSCNIAKEDRMQVRSSGDAYAILTGYWNMDLLELQEEFNIIILNRSNEVLGIYNISKGGSTGTIVDAKLVFATALKCNANSIVLAHNHPSGNLSPSQNDLNLTRKLKKAGEVLDISVVDHLILTKDGYYSFADEGIL